MRIAILTTASMFSGAERHSLQLTEYLRELGHDAFLVCAEESTYRVYKAAVGESVPLFLIKSTLKRDSGGFFEWRKIFRELKSDVCIFEKPTLLHGSAQFDLAARICNKRYITIQQVAHYKLPHLWTPFLGMLHRFKFWVLRARLKGYSQSLFPHLTITVSDSVRDNFISFYGFSKRKTITVRNGVDSEQYKPNLLLRNTSRNKYGIPTTASVFGTACRLSPEKGIDFALSCFSRITGEFFWLIWTTCVGDCEPTRRSM
jgi:glycosyltransferase involved in cell wall biosynthesis